MPHLRDNETLTTTAKIAASTYAFEALDGNVNQTSRRATRWSYKHTLGGAAIATFLMAQDLPRTDAALVDGSSRTTALEFLGGTQMPVSVTWGSDTTAHSVPDQIIMELANLEDNWAGGGSVAPSDIVLSDVEDVVGLLPSDVCMPNIEVEEDDGSIALRWVSVEKTKSFSLVFRGNGRVTAVSATVDPPRSKTSSASVKNDINVAALFDEAMIGGAHAVV